MKIAVSRIKSLIHWQEVAVGIILSLLTLWFFKPYVLNPATTLPDPVDGGLISFVLHRVDENITTNNLLFDGKIFHPYTNTLL